MPGELAVSTNRLSVEVGVLIEGAPISSIYRTYGEEWQFSGRQKTIANGDVVYLGSRESPDEAKSHLVVSRRPVSQYHQKVTQFDLTQATRLEAIVPIEEDISPLLDSLEPGKPMEPEDWAEVGALLEAYKGPSIQSGFNEVN